MGDSSAWRDWAGLPRLALQSVLSQLLVETRLSCRFVCRGWAAAIWEEVTTLVHEIPDASTLHSVDIAPLMSGKPNLILRVHLPSGEDTMPYVSPPISAHFFALGTEAIGPMGMKLVYHPIVIMNDWERELGALQYVRCPPLSILPRLQSLDLTEAGFFQPWGANFLALSLLTGLTDLAFSMQTEAHKSEVPPHVYQDLCTPRDDSHLRIDDSAKALAALNPALSLPQLSHLKVYVSTSSSDAFPRFWLHVGSVVMGDNTKLMSLHISGPPRWDGDLFVDDLQHRDNCVVVTATRREAGETADIRFGISQLLPPGKCVEDVLKDNEPVLRESVLTKLVLDVAQPHALRGLDRFTRLQSLKIMDKVDAQALAVWLDQGVFLYLTQLTKLELCGALHGDEVEDDDEERDGFPVQQGNSHFLLSSVVPLLAQQLTGLRSLCLQDVAPISRPEYDAGESAEAMQSLTRLSHLSSLHMSFHESEAWVDETGSAESMETFAYVDVSWMPTTLTSLAFIHVELLLPTDAASGAAGAAVPDDAAKLAAKGCHSTPRRPPSCVPPSPSSPFPPLQHLHLESVLLHRSTAVDPLAEASHMLLPPIPTLTSATLHDCTVIWTHPQDSGSDHIQDPADAGGPLELRHIACAWQNLTRLDFELSDRAKYGQRLSITGADVPVLNSGLSKLQKLRLSAFELTMDTDTWEMLAGWLGLTSLRLQFYRGVFFDFGGMMMLKQVQEVVFEDWGDEDEVRPARVKMVEFVKRLAAHRHPRTVLAAARDELRNEILYSTVVGWIEPDGYWPANFV